MRVLENHVQHLRDQERRRAKFRAEMDTKANADPSEGAAHAAAHLLHPDAASSSPREV